MRSANVKWAIKEKFILVDARKISIQALGKYFPNSQCSQQLSCSQWCYEKDALFRNARLLISINLQKKPEVIDGNMQALELTYEELKDVL